MENVQVSAVYFERPVYGTLHILETAETDNGRQQHCQHWGHKAALKPGVKWFWILFFHWSALSSKRSVLNFIGCQENQAKKNQVQVDLLNHFNRPLQVAAHSAQ